MSSSSANSDAAKALLFLQKQFRDLVKCPLGGFKVEASPSNLFEWTIWFLGPKQTPYEGGCYKAKMKFPNDFPYSPPTLYVVSSFWHPNVYPNNGEVCISILHSPGIDEHNDLETAEMRWTPVQSIEKVLVSFISLLSDPDSREAGAPANVEALSMYRKEHAKFIKRCEADKEQSLRELPPGFVLPDENDFNPEAPNPKIINTLNLNLALYHQKSTSPFYPSPSGSNGSNASGGKENTSDPKVRYREELQQIKDMGISNGKSDTELLEICVKCKGDMEKIMGLLMN